MRRQVWFLLLVVAFLAAAILVCWRFGSSADRITARSPRAVGQVKKANGSIFSDDPALIPSKTNEKPGDATDTNKGGRDIPAWLPDQVGKGIFDALRSTEVQEASRSPLCKEIFGLAESLGSSELFEGVIAGSAAGGKRLWVYAWALVLKMLSDESGARTVVARLLSEDLDEKARGNLLYLLGKVSNERREVMDFLIAQLMSANPIASRQEFLMALGGMQIKRGDDPIEIMISGAGDMSEEWLREFNRFELHLSFEVVPPTDVIDILCSPPLTPGELSALDLPWAYEEILRCLNFTRDNGKPHQEDAQIRRKLVEATIRACSTTDSAKVWEPAMAALALAETSEADAVVLRTLLGGHEDEMVRTTAASWLGERSAKSTDVQAALIQACNDSSFRVRVAAAHNLSVDSALKSTAVSSLEKLFREDECEPVRRAALEGLARVLGADAMPYVEEARQSEDELMRKTAGFCVSIIERATRDK